MSAPMATVLHELTAVEQCEALRDRSVSAVELTTHYLDRIDRLGERLGAFVVTTPELALREAAEADRQFARGLPAHLALQGLPMGFKDLQPIAGVPVTNGSAVLPAVTADEDAEAVGLIRAAGAVMLGTTHAPELGIPCYTDTTVVGRPAVTPYDLGRSASGSSGGAAAAVAAGLLPVGHGSDGAGSIRTPAAVCGLVGVKPSRGVVSTAPASSFFGFSTDGPLARTVEDAALLLDAMAVKGARSVHRHGERPSSFLAASRRRPKRGLRIAVWTESGLGAVDQETAAAVDQVARLLEEHGHDIDVIPNPAPWEPPLVQAFFDYIGGVVSGLLVDLPEAQAHALEEDTRWMKKRGDLLGAGDFVRSTTALATFADRFVAGLEPYDLAVSPVSAGVAVPLGSFHRGASEEAPYRMLEWSAYTPLQNMSGLPAISIPSTLTPVGLPLGVQLTGTAIGSDPLLLSVAAQLQEQIAWVDVHPPTWRE